MKETEEDPFGFNFDTPEGVEEKVEDIKEEEKETSKGKKEDEADEEEISDFAEESEFDFGGDEESEEEEEVVEDKKPEEASTDDSTEESDEEYNSSWNEVYDDYRESGLFKHVELEEDQELTEETFKELQEQEFEAEVEERVTAFADGLDDEAREFLKFKKSGGSTKKFLEFYSENSFDLNGDIEDPKFQDKVISNKLKEEGWDDVDIKDHLEYLGDKNTKAKHAKKFFEKAKSNSDKAKANFLAKEAERREEMIRKEEEFKSNLKASLDSTKDVRGIKVNKKERDNLYNMVVERDVNGTTKLQSKLNEYFSDNEKLILLAKFMNDDFDMKSIKREAKTNATANTKRKINRSRKTRNTRPNTQGKSVADFFE